MCIRFCFWEVSESFGVTTGLVDKKKGYICSQDKLISQKIASSKVQVDVNLDGEGTHPGPGDLGFESHLGLGGGGVSLLL